MSRPEYKESITVCTRLDFQLNSDDIPRFWMDGDPFKTRLMDCVQATFPDGERYFIASVRAFRDRVEDPVLKREIKDFMMQEGQHGQVHTDFNERLRRQGILIDLFTQQTRVHCERRLAKKAPEYNIAYTAAMEHFTAMMAELFYAQKAAMAGADERIRAMLAWHAIEEMEHKAVAYDVMQKVAGVGYWLRVRAMTRGVFDFTMMTLIAPWYMLKMDGFSWRERVRLYLRGSVWMLGPRQGVLTRLLPMVAKYYRPGFHPNHLPTVHNYTDWIKRFAATRDPIEAARAMYAAAV